MKKLIDRIIERLYVKRFPERAGHFPLPDIIEINKKRLSVVTLHAEKRFCRDYYPENLRMYFIQEMRNSLIDYLVIEEIQDPREDEFVFRATINVLKEN